jgi:hypothetical protein
MPKVIPPPPRIHGPNRALPVLEHGRSCGECTACCTWAEIPEASDTARIAHARGVDCQQLGAGGCRAYGSRPKVCSDFRCLWHEGFGADEDRPDILGVMFHIAPDETGQPFVAANELRPGALDGRAAEHVREMGFRVRVISVSADGERRVLVMPASMARAFDDPEVAHAAGMVKAP